jgi:hypothetical protein
MKFSFLIVALASAAFAFPFATGASIYDFVVAVYV